MTTLKAVINTALRKARILAAGEEAAPDEFQDAQADLRRMVDTWRLENLMVYVNAIKQFALQPGAASYTIGTGATWNNERPVNILSATIKDGSGGSFPLVRLTSNQYSQLGHKNQIGRPSRFYFHPTFPLAEVRFDRIPDDPTVELVLQESLTIPAQLTDTLSFPPGYEDAIIYNLAIRLAADYGKQPASDVLGLAASFKALIKRNNIEVPLLAIEHGTSRVPGTYDIYAGPGA